MTNTTTPAPDPSTGARIGPNAITRVAEILAAVEGTRACDEIFAQAGLANYLTTPPSFMLPEHHVTALHAALHAKLGPPRARVILWLAGRRTGEYLLAHRIPRAAQTLLRLLLTPLNTRLLCALILRNGWTFAGSGQLRITHAGGTVISIAANPLAAGTDAPGCVYFAATFETLFAALAHPGAHVVEHACAARGAEACEFELRLPARVPWLNVSSLIQSAKQKEALLF